MPMNGLAVDRVFVYVYYSLPVCIFADISRGIFHSRLKTLHFSKSFPPQPSISCSDSSPGI